METIDLKPFCDYEDGRYALTTPWVKGGWRYATDGRICVRTPTTEPDSPKYNEDGLKRPDAAGLFSRFPDSGFYELPATLDEETSRDEDAWRECDCAEWIQCPRCKGDMCERCEYEGQVIKAAKGCKMCGGRGKLPHVYQRIGNEWFDRWYIAKVRALPGVTVRSLDENRLAFVFDGGQGLLMAVRSPHGVTHAT